VLILMNEEIKLDKKAENEMLELLRDNVAREWN